MFSTTSSSTRQEGEFHAGLFCFLALFDINLSFLKISLICRFEAIGTPWFGEEKE
jgi:hypothetical protein